MSREQVQSFQSHRNAADPQGDLTWAARFGQKALRVSSDTLAHLDVEQEFELSEDERVLWRLLKLPRKYLDLEHAGVLPVAVCRAFLRGLVAADVVDILNAPEAKALLPAEVKRLKVNVSDVQQSRATGRERLAVNERKRPSGNWRCCRRGWPR